MEINVNDMIGLRRIDVSERDADKYCNECIFNTNPGNCNVPLPLFKCEFSVDDNQIVITKNFIWEEAQ